VENQPLSGKSAAAWLLLGSALLSLAIGVAGYVHTSAGTSVAIHFSLDGTPNGWTSPARAFFMMPLIGVGLLLLQLLTPRIKPSADRLERRILAVVLGIAGVLLVAAQIYIFWRAV
jgi:hypothetical protein